MSHRRIPKCHLVRNRVDHIGELAKGKRVLHLGCADALHLNVEALQKNFLHKILFNQAKSLVGVDFDGSALVKLDKILPGAQLIEGNVENLELGPQEPFDLIVAGELIEHLNNPGNFLTSVRKYMTAETRLVITTPNMHAIKIAIDSLRGISHMHPDHCVGFTFALLETLLKRHGMEVVEWACGMESSGTGRSSRVNTLLKPVTAIYPHFADTLIAVVRLTR